MGPPLHISGGAPRRLRARLHTVPVHASEIVINVIGWLGTGLLLSAYALLTTARLPAGRAFQVMNLVGGFFLLLNSAYYGAWPSAGLNLVWVVIGTAGLLRFWSSSRRSARQPAAPC